jgi:hypothetical protein
MANDRVLKESEVVAAFHVLFSSGGGMDISCVDSIQAAQLKSAYRKKALSTHPDRFAACGEEVQRLYSERFIKVRHAYDTLTHYLALREQGWNWSTHRLNEARSTAPKTASTQPPPASAWTGGSSTAGQEQPGSSFWQKTVPRRYLRFAEFLYFNRVIPWTSFVNALVWQRRQRPRIGEIAQKWRWVSSTQVELLLRNRRPGEKLGEALVRHGFITPFALDVLLRHQRRIQKPIGLYFVRHGLMSEWDVGRFLLHQRRHNMMFTSAFAGA